MEAADGQRVTAARHHLALAVAITVDSVLSFSSSFRN